MESPTQYRTIIVALDGTRLTEQHLLPPARELAGIYRATLVLVRAAEHDILPAREDPAGGPNVAIAAGPTLDHVSGLAIPGGGAVAGDDFPARAFEDQDSAGYLNILGNELQAAGFTVEHVDSDGDAADALVAEAEARDAPLIVMGTHQRSRWERLFKGSTAEKVLRTSPCPVLVVPLD